MNSSDQHITLDSQLILNNSYFGVILTDESVILEVNQKALELLESEQNDLIGKNLDVITCHEDLLPEGILNIQIHHLPLKTFKYIYTEQGEKNGPMYLGCLMLIEEIKPCPNDPAPSFQEPIFGSNVLGFGIIDNSLKIIDVNDTTCRLIGFSREELIGKSYMELGIVPDSIELSREREEFWKSLMESGTKKNIQKDIQKKNGEKLTFLFSIEQIHIRNENYWMVSIQDITEKKQSQEKKERLYHQLHNHLNNSPLGIVEYDSAFKIIQWSPRCEDIFKWNKEEALQNDFTIHDLIHDKKKNQQTTQVLNELISGSESGNVLYTTNVTKTGGSIDCVWYNSVVKNEHGQIISIMSLVQDITESKNLEKSILNEKTLSENIINSLPGIFYLYDQKGNILLWNKNLEKITGYSTNEVQAMKPTDFFEGDYKTMVLDKMASVFKNGEDSLEADYVLKSGEKVPYYFTGKAVEYKGKRCLIGVGIDISQRVNARKLLEKSNRQLISAQRISKLGYWEWEWKEKKMYWSEEMYSILKTDQIIKEATLLARIHPDDRMELEKKKKKVFEDYLPQSVSLRFTSFQGTTIHLHIKASPIFDKLGNFSRLEGTLQDITESVQKEEALKKSNERYELLSKATNDAIWDWDINNNSLTGNERFYTLYDLPFPEGQLNDMIFFSKIHPDDVDKIKKSVKETLKNGDPSFVEEYLFMYPDGKYRPILDRAYVLYDRKGRAYRMIGAMQDISKQKNIK